MRFAHNVYRADISSLRNFLHFLSANNTVWCLVDMRFKQNSGQQGDFFHKATNKQRSAHVVDVLSFFITYTVGLEV